jgi:DUF971 family protein
MTAPLDIAHHVREDALELTWEDGLSARLPGPLLRGWCPCATCQGHSPGLRFHDPGPVTIAGLAEVGAYALNIRFSDGHDTGIYSWEYLRKIDPQLQQSSQ